MSDGYEQAKGQRNFLERLGAMIPGYRGFQDRELRRDVDKTQREHLAGEVGRLKAALANRARDYTDAGQIAALGPFGRIDRQLDGLQQAIRFSDYGASGLFDAVKIGEPELERLYAFDLSIVDDVAALGQAIAAVPAPGGAGDSGSALDRVRDLVRALDDKWRQRSQVISQVLSPAPPAPAPPAGTPPAPAIPPTTPPTPAQPA